MPLKLTTARKREIVAMLPEVSVAERLGFAAAQAAT